MDVVYSGLLLSCNLSDPSAESGCSIVRATVLFGFREEVLLFDQFGVHVFEHHAFIVGHASMKCVVCTSSVTQSRCSEVHVISSLIGLVTA